MPRYVRPSLSILLALGAVHAQSSTQPNNEQPQHRTAWIDITQSGCSPSAIPNDGQDDTTAIQCALAKLPTAGGTLYIPTGQFEIRGTIAIPSGVRVEGDGMGSIFHQPHDFLGPILVLARETALRKIKLTQDHPPSGPGPWTPFQDYDYQIEIQGGITTVEEVMLLNPYKGILIAPSDPSGAIGQIILSNVRGQPLGEGIHVDHVLDVVHIEKVHFWPFWSDTDPVKNWTATHAKGIVSCRADNPQFSQLFFFAYGIGLEFASSGATTPTSGITSKPKVSQIDCDYCAVGVKISGAGTRGVMLYQFSVQGFPGSGLGLYVSASDVSMLVDQADFTVLDTNAVRVEGNNVAVSITNAMVRDWNRSGKGFPAFEVVTGSSNSYVNVFNSLYGNGYGAPISNASVLISGTNPAPL